MLRSLLSRALLTILATCAYASMAGATNVIVSHQGRLLDSADEPVSGPVTMTFRIYDVPTGGVALWSEVQTGVPVVDGLFSAPLGSVTPLSVDVLSPSGSTPDRWLGVTVGGTELLPRMLLGSVPRAAASTRVTGDISTAPGQMQLGQLDHGMVQLFTSPDSAVGDYVQGFQNDANRVKIRSTATDAGIFIYRDGSTTGTIRTSNSGGHIGLSGHSGSTTGTIRMMAAPDSAVAYLDVDSDDDGIPESSDRRTISANQVHHNVMSRSGSTTGTIRMATTPNSAYSALETDANNNGLPERAVTMNAGQDELSLVVEYRDGDDPITHKRTGKQSANAGGARWLLEDDLDGNGDAECVASTTTSSTGASQGLYKKGLNAVNVKTAMTDSVGDAGFVRRIQWDIDNDGNYDVESTTTGDSTGARSTWKGGMSGSTTGTIRVAASGGGGPVMPSSSILLEADLDGDGVADNSCSSGSDGSASTVAVSSRFGSGPRQTTSMDGSFNRSSMECSSDTDNDGVVDNSCTALVTPTTSNLAIKTKGTGAQRQTVTMGTESAGTASFECAIDDDADGISDRSVGGDCDDTDATFSVKGGGGGGGGAQNSVQFTVDTHGPIVDIIKPGDGEMKFSVDGSGPQVRISEPSSANSIKWNVDSQGPVIELTAPGTNSSVHFEVDATGPFIRMTNSGTIMSDVDGSGSAYFASNLGIGVPSPTHHIDVTGGAYCDGTNWVNASDKNSKENFQKVDGEELLDKIAELDITKWNYKNDKETEHIGPTAQDFQEKFGVGSDGKSISTIDPSGIALAAIKELYSQLKSRDQQFESELKKRDKAHEAQLEALQKEIKTLRDELKRKN